METLIVHPKNKEQLAAIKALKIDFKTEKNTYNSEFVAKILKAKDDVTKGKGVKIAIEELWN